MERREFGGRSARHFVAHAAHRFYQRGLFAEFFAQVHNRHVYRPVGHGIAVAVQVFYDGFARENPALSLQEHFENREFVGGQIDGLSAYFHFVEFKTNAICQSDAGVEETYEKAIQQLISTLELFKEVLAKVKIDFLEKLHVECHVIVSSVFPRNNASEMTKAWIFAQKTGISLSFENEIELN